jgi:hypothetical protein
LAARGITVRRVMSGNGSGYVSRVFRTTCVALGLRHLGTRAYTPRMLCSAASKALRFASTALTRGPSGLDAASAQLVIGQVRDGLL